MEKDIFKSFEIIPCFTKQNLRAYFKGSELALNERIKRALKKKQIFELTWSLKKMEEKLSKKLQRKRF